VKESEGIDWENEETGLDEVRGGTVPNDFRETLCAGQGEFDLLAGAEGRIGMASAKAGGGDIHEPGLKDKIFVAGEPECDGAGGFEAGFRATVFPTDRLPLAGVLHAEILSIKVVVLRP